MTDLRWLHPPPSRYGSQPTPIPQAPGLWTVHGGAPAFATQPLPVAHGADVWVITDPGVRSQPWFDPALRACRAALRLGSVQVYDAVGPDPTETDAARAARAVRGAGLLIAVGGGGVLDTAKAAALLQAHPGPMGALQGFHPGLGPTPPILAVPTTAGTGSEAQSFALISADDDHRKMACGAPGALPALALLDPVVLRTCPARAAALAGLDALVHAVETRVTRVGTPASRACAEDAFAALWAALPRALAHPEDDAARAAVQRGAARAGQAIEASMLGAAHALANPLTARWDVPHGLAVATTLPAVVRHNARAPEVAQAYAALAAEAGLSGPPALADALAALPRALGLHDPPPPIPADDLPGLVAEAQAQWTLGFNPVPWTEEEIEGVYGGITPR